MASAAAADADLHPDPAFRLSDTEALVFAGRVAFAHLFAQTQDGPRVAHVPVLVASGTLRFHLAKRNALTPHLAGLTVLASIGGPGAYVSPSWYRDGRDQVPTWNYVAVELEGPVRALAGEELIDLLDASAAEHERRVGQSWTRAKMEPARFAAMCDAITGFALRIDVIRATAKLSQNKSAHDVAGVLVGLRELADPPEPASLGDMYRAVAATRGAFAG